MTTFRGEHVELASLDADATPMDVYADGERVGPLPATMEAVPRRARRARAATATGLRSASRRRRRAAAAGAGFAVAAASAASSVIGVAGDRDRRPPCRPPGGPGSCSRRRSRRPHRRTRGPRPCRRPLVTASVLEQRLAVLEVRTCARRRSLVSVMLGDAGLSASAVGRSNFERVARLERERVGGAGLRRAASSRLHLPARTLPSASQPNIMITTTKPPVDERERRRAHLRRRRRGSTRR